MVSSDSHQIKSSNLTNVLPPLDILLVSSCNLIPILLAILSLPQYNAGVATSGKAAMVIPDPLLSFSQDSGFWALLVLWVLLVCSISRDPWVSSLLVVFALLNNRIPDARICMLRLISAFQLAVLLVLLDDSIFSPLSSPVWFSLVPGIQVSFVVVVRMLLPSFAKDPSLHNLLPGLSWFLVRICNALLSFLALHPHSWMILGSPFGSLAGF